MLIGRLADDTTCSLYRPKQIRVLLFSLLMLVYYRLKVQTLSSYDTIVVLYYVSFYLVRAIALHQIKSLRLRLKYRQLVFALCPVHRFFYDVCVHRVYLYLGGEM